MGRWSRPSNWRMPRPGRGCQARCDGSGARTGPSNREIARALHLTEGTVKNHVSNMLWKLGVRNRTRAVLRGLQLGLTPGGDRPS
jgi:regulatory LuxR family protein